jgi:CDP-glucose 4,6-dehydratase
MTNEFWQGKRVLVTGHTGFKGSWLSIWLHRLGAEVYGVGLPPVTQPSLFESAAVDSICRRSDFCDIRDVHAIASVIADSDPEILFHLAAQPLVRASYRNPLETFATNVQGTANVLNAARETRSTKVIVAITTDKVYRNSESPFPFRETDELGGHDPYSASKAASEIVIASYREAFFREKGVAVASARAGNVIGGGDWSEDRLIPDAVRAWMANTALEVRRPESTRPWQHVLEPLAGYLSLARIVWERPSLADAYNFGPESYAAASVRTVVEQARTYFGLGDVVWGNTAHGPKEASVLALEISKSRSVLGFAPTWRLNDSIGRTMRWYRSFAEGASARELCIRDIEDYEAVSQGSLDVSSMIR